jgi:hypothetical protein
MRTGLTALVPVGAMLALILVRPVRRVPVVILGAFIVVLGAWLAIPPSHERDWQLDVATLPFADIRGDHVIVHNVRNAEYRSETDYTVRLEDRELDLSRLRSLDLFLINWGSPWIAHTIMSWGFEGDQYLAISIETRKEKGEVYSALRGFFREYELFYVVAEAAQADRIGLGGLRTALNEIFSVYEDGGAHPEIYLIGHSFGTRIISGLMESSLALIRERQDKPGEGGPHELSVKPFDGILRVFNPARQGWPPAGSESCAVLRGDPHREA